MVVVLFHRLDLFIKDCLWHDQTSFALLDKLLQKPLTNKSHQLELIRKTESLWASGCNQRK